MGHFLGPKKIIFLIRDIDDATRPAAPVEICQFVVLRSPRGRLGSVVYTCNRLRRLRRRFQRKIHLPWSFAPYPLVCPDCIAHYLRRVVDAIRERVSYRYVLDDRDAILAFDPYR